MKRFVREMAEFLQVGERRPFARWIEEEVVIPEGECAGQPFRWEERPWTRILAEAMEDRREVWLCAVPRLGKSLYAFSWLLWRGCEHRDPVQLVVPSEDIGLDAIGDKVEPILFTSPTLRRLVPVGYTRGAKQLQRLLRFRSGGALRTVYNPDTMRGYESRAMMVTEASREEFNKTKNEADVIKMAIRRQDEFRGGLQFYESTPTRPDSRFQQGIAEGTDSRIHCPCPHCGVYFDPGARACLKGWRVEADDESPDANDEVADMPESAVRGHVECPHCRGRIEEKHRPAMRARGRLVHTHPDRAVLSVTVDWWHAKHTIQDVALAEHRLARKPDVSDLRDLLQNFYATPVSEEDERGEDDRPGLAVTSETLVMRAAGHARGARPAQALALCGSIDVQKKWLYHMLLGIDANGGLYVVDYGSVEIVPYAEQRMRDPDESEVVGALNRAYAELMRHQPEAGIWLDVNYKHVVSQMPVVRTWACERANVYQIVGKSDEDYARSRKSLTEIPPALRSYMGPWLDADGNDVWRLNVDLLKELLWAKYSFPIGAAGGFHLPAGTKPNQSLVRHLLSEEKTYIRNNRGGRVGRWQKKRGAGRNDLFDCAVYAYAGALLFATEQLERLPGADVTEPPADEEAPGESAPASPATNTAADGWHAGGTGGLGLADTF